MKKVAIITPIYNSEKFLKDMIESVLKQSYRFFELVLIDDASADNSPYICKKYSSAYKNIHYIAMDVNSGPGLARNKGIKFVKEKLNCNFFAFIDSDDVVAETYLERMVDALQKSNTRIVVSRTTKNALHDSEDTIVINSNELYKCRKRYQLFPGNGIGAKLFDHSLIDSFTFPKERHEDLFIIPSIILSEQKICLLDAALYFYRYRPESESHHNSFHFSMLDRLSALECNLEFVLSNNIDAKYHFYNEYFEYLNYLISITKKNKKIYKDLIMKKRNQLIKYKNSIITEIGKSNYYRYLLTEKSFRFKIVSRFLSK